MDEQNTQQTEQNAEQAQQTEQNAGQAQQTSGQTLTVEQILENQQKEIDALKKENASLRESNTKLLTQGNVGKPTQTVEEVIHDLFVGR